MTRRKSQNLYSTYSGMIPGFIEGVYSWRESHIDLYKLSLRLNIRFIHSKVINISSANKEIYLKDRPSIKFDVLSLILAGIFGKAFLFYMTTPDGYSGKISNFRIFCKLLLNSRILTCFLTLQRSLVL